MLLYCKIKHNESINVVSHYLVFGFLKKTWFPILVCMCVCVCVCVCLLGRAVSSEINKA